MKFMKYGRTIAFAALLASFPGMGCSSKKTIPCPNFTFEAFAQSLHEDAETWDFTAGKWTQGWGDDNFFGLSFYINAGNMYDRADFRAKAKQAYDYNLKVIKDSNANIIYFFEHMEEVLMAILGTMEYIYATNFTADLAEVDKLIDTVNSIVDGFNDYIEAGGIQSFALDNYGPTSITAFMALLNLQYAKMLSTAKSASRKQRGLEILKAIDDKAFNGSFYAFKPGEAKLYLYPNATAMILLVRAYQLTGKSAYLDRADLIFNAIQPLKNPTQHNYYSPYSAAVMGAQTDDYSTLSSQNYLTLALILLHEVTGKEKYRTEAHQVLTFIHDRLYDRSVKKVLHHWMDGRIALPADPEYFCSGCNLQLMYILWYMKNKCY